MNIINLNDRQLASVLAGLRLLQQVAEGAEGDPYAIDEIASDCGMFDPLNDAEIDHLIMHINQDAPITAHPQPASRRFLLTAQDGDISVNFDVVHTLGSDADAVEAIKAGIRAWLETADIPEKKADGDCPFSMFTWSHYADYCQDITIPGIVSVTWLNNHYIADLEEDFLSGDDD